MKKRLIISVLLQSTYLIIIFFLLSCVRKVEITNVKIGIHENISLILIPEKPDPIIEFAALELKNYIHEITGKELTVKSFTKKKNHEQSINLIIDKQDSSLHWDGFRIEISDKSITLVSREPRGILYGVYELLEKTGCSFVYPGKQEEIVPQLGEIVFKSDTLVFNPKLEHRGLVPYGLDSNSVEMGRIFFDWMAKNKFNYVLVSENRLSDADGSGHTIIWKDVSKQLLPELQKRGFVIEMSEHSTSIFFPRSLHNEHPEWFALNKGKRDLGPPPFSGQMCYSNMDAVEYYANSVAEYASKHPEFHVIGTWPLDGGNYCECENCKDPQTVLKAAIKVAEKVKVVRPDIVVEHLAYQPQSWQPPLVDTIPQNLSVLWCPDPGEKDSLAHIWIEKSKNAGGVYLFEYYMGDNYRTSANIWLRPEYSTFLVTYCENMGFRGVISLCIDINCWWRNSLNDWFFSRACWGYSDTRQNLELYCNRYYGDYAGQVLEVFDIIFNELQSEPYNYNTVPDQERLERVRNIAEQIEEKLDRLSPVTDKPEINERILRLKVFTEYFKLHTEARMDRNPDHIEKLIGFCKEHKNQNMVFIYPEYIKWRLRF